MFCNKLDTEGLIKYPSVMIATLLCVIGRNWFITKSSLKRVAYVLMEIGCPWNNLVTFYGGGGGGGALPPETGKGERSAGWIFTPTGLSAEWIFTPTRVSNFRRNMKMLQILPKESASEQKRWCPTGVCLTFEYPTRGCSEKGGLKDGTSLLTLTNGVLIRLYTWTIVLEIDH